LWQLHDNPKGYIPNHIFKAFIKHDFTILKQLTQDIFLHIFDMCTCRQMIFFHKEMSYIADEPDVGNRAPNLI